MKKPIKVIKRTGKPEPEHTPAPPLEAAHTQREVERDLQDAVNGWIEERRRNDKIETGIAKAHLRASRV